MNFLRRNKSEWIHIVGHSCVQLMLTKYWLDNDGRWSMFGNEQDPLPNRSETVGLHRSPMDSPHKGSVTWKMFPFDDVIMWCQRSCKLYKNRLLTWKVATGIQRDQKEMDSTGFNTLRPRQNGRPFADDTFKCIFLNENVRISIKISLKFVLKGPINNNPALVQIMAWRQSGDKPLSEPMMFSLLTHICVTRPQWVKGWLQSDITWTFYSTTSMYKSLWF